MKKRFFRENEGPTNCVGTGHIAGMDGTTGKSRMRKKIMKRGFRKHLNESQFMTMIPQIIDQLNTLSQMYNMIDMSSLQHMAPKSGALANQIAAHTARSLLMAKKLLQNRSAKPLEKAEDKALKKAEKRATLKSKITSAKAQAGAIVGASVHPIASKVSNFKKNVKKRKLGEAVFDISPESYMKSVRGKSRYHKWSRYVGNDEDGHAVRNFARDRKNNRYGITLRDRMTGAHSILRKGK